MRKSTYRLILLAVVILLMFSVAEHTFAASNSGGATNTDTWFTITPEQPYTEAAYYYSWLDSMPDYSASIIDYYYYRNDQTLIGLNLSFASLPFWGSESEGNIIASIMDESGLFIGFNLRYRYDSFSNDNTTTYAIVPGYRFNLDEYSYIAISSDWISTGSGLSLNNYVIGAVYFWDRGKLNGAITFPISGEPKYNMGLNWKATEALIIHGSLGSSTAGLIPFSLGCTWGAETNLVIDARYNAGWQYSSLSDLYSASYDYSVNGMLKVTPNLSIGAEYYANPNDQFLPERNTVKAKYQTGESDLLIIYTLPYKGSSSSIRVAYVEKI